MKNIILTLTFLFSLSLFSQEFAAEFRINQFQGDNYFQVNAGVLANFEVSETLKIETGLRINGLNNDDPPLSIPVNFKYYKNVSGFYFKGGFEYIDGGFAGKGEMINGGIGVGYDIDDKFTVVADYSVPLDNSAYTNSFGISLQYHFNKLID